jgi:hypothetical protein
MGREKGRLEVGPLGELCPRDCRVKRGDEIGRFVAIGDIEKLDSDQLPDLARQVGASRMSCRACCTKHPLSLTEEDEVDAPCAIPRSSCTDEGAHVDKHPVEKSCRSLDSHRRLIERLGSLEEGKVEEAEDVGGVGSRVAATCRLRSLELRRAE